MSVVQRREKVIATCPVEGTDAPHVSIQIATRHELGERRLGELRDVAVATTLFGHRRAKCGRQDEPADAQTGPECLARGAEIHHSVGRDALERADGVTVVAELAVVVVLDDPRVAFSGPIDKARAALGSS